MRRKGMVNYMKLLISLTLSAAALSLCTLPAFAENFTVAPIDTSSALLCILVLALVFAAMAFVVRQGRSGRANVPWAVLASLLTGAAMLTAIVGSSVGTLYTKPDGDPRETVSAFFEALSAGEYENAYSYLGDYTGLGLENVPGDKNGELVYATMRENFDCRVTGGAEIIKLGAKVPVRIRYLNMASTQGDIEEQINKNLERFVKDNPRNLVYDAENHYLPELTEKLYDDALRYVLDHSNKYCVTEQFDMELVYRDGRWLILTNPKLLSALTGAMA